MMNKSNYNHIKSVPHKIFDKSIITRYIIQDPHIKKIHEIMKKYNIIYDKKSERFVVSCVLKLLTTTNQVR